MMVRNRMADDGVVVHVGGTVARHRVSTACVPVRDRMPFWQSTVSAALQPVRLSPVEGGPDFEAAFERIDAGGAKITRGTLSSVRALQFAADVDSRAGRTVQVALHETGRLVVESTRGTHVFGPRSMLVHTDDETVVHTHLARTQMVLLTVDLERLTIPVSALREAMHRPLAVDGMLRSLVLGAAETVRHAGATMDATGTGAYLTGVAELVLRTATGRSTEHVGTADARRRQVLDVVAARSQDPHLTVSSLASAVGVTPRRLHQLFADEGGVAAQIRTARLGCAAGLLRDPAWAHRTVAAVAERSGFVDHSQFSRAFRRHYGCSPSAYRT